MKNEDNAKIGQDLTSGIETEINLEGAVSPDTVQHAETLPQIVQAQDAHEAMSSQTPKTPERSNKGRSFIDVVAPLAMGIVAASILGQLLSGGRSNDHLLNRG